MMHYVLCIDDNYNRDSVQTEIFRWLSSEGQDGITMMGRELRFGIEDSKNKKFRDEVWPQIKDKISSYEEPSATQ